jgi:hypothetical protein
MGMENHRDGCARTRARVETAFEATFRARKNDFGHLLLANLMFRDAQNRLCERV